MHGLLAREVVNEPYRTETAFDKTPAQVLEKGRELGWMVDVLEQHYNLRVSGARVRYEVEFGPHGYEIATLRTGLGDPFLFLGFSKQEVFSDCELALRKLLLLQRTASAAVASDGQQYVFLRRRHDSERCEYSKDLERENSDAEQIPLFHVSPTNSVPLETVFFESHSAVRDIDGMHADEALDELCKVIFTLVDIGNEQRRNGSVGGMLACGGLHSLERAAIIRRAYLDASKHNANDDGDAFSEPFRLSDAALLRVWRLLAPFDLSKISSDLKGRAFQRVIDPAIRAGMGQFFTPTPVVEFVVSAVFPCIGESVLDPFCGSGHFLSKTFELAAEATPKSRAKALEWAKTSLHGIEKSERMLRIARTDMLLGESRLVSLHRHDALAPFSNYASLRAGSFDVVLTNPPFGSLLGPDAISALGALELARDRGSTALEVLGLERSIQFLKPRGRIGIVLPEGLFTNQRLRHVRAWLLRHVHLVAIISLPVETFSPYGANVRTCVLFAAKRHAPGEPGPRALLVGGSESVGYDAAGRANTKPCDLPELAIAVRAAFLSARNN